MSKQFAATDKKLKKAKEDGDVARSQYFSITAMCFCLYGFYSFNFYPFQIITECFMKFSDSLFWQGGEGIANALSFFSYKLLISSLICLLILSVVGVSSELLQVGFNFSLKKVKFNFGKLNLAKNLKNIFWKKGEEEALPAFIRQMLKSLILLTLCSIGAGFIIFYKFGIITADFTDVGQVKEVIQSVFSKLILFISFSLFAVAFSDYLYSRMSRNKRLRMTRDEFKREVRSSEGDPEVRASRRQTHREIIAHNLIQGVRKARVVLSTKR